MNAYIIYQAPTYITRTLPKPQSDIDDVHSPYTPHNPHTNTLEVTQARIHTKHGSLHQFLLETLPRQVYLFILLGLPTFYSTQVTKIFEDAETSIEMTQQAREHINEEDGVNFDAAAVLPLYTNSKSAWKTFIDSLMREYKTFNLISVLLFSAVLAILQIESAAGDPLTRFSALLSLICALISFLYGCIYIIRFGSMRKTLKAEQWAIEAQKTKASIFWNVWVLLAMPSIWLAWSILFFIVGILSFVWRTGTTASDTSPPIITARDILGPRIAITAIFGLGLTYSIFILTTFRRYANAMDKTQTTHMKSRPSKNAALPTSQGAQLENRQQTWPIHPLALPPKLACRHHSYPPYKAPETPNIPIPSTVTLQGSSGVNTPVGATCTDEKHTFSLHPQTTRLSSSPCSSNPTSPSLMPESSLIHAGVVVD